MRNPIKPPALLPGGSVRIISPASAAKSATVRLGATELARLGYCVRGARRAIKPQGYFAGTQAQRGAELEAALRDASADAVICARGGYGAGALLDGLQRSTRARPMRPKLLIGYSDITMLQAFLWQRLRWTSLYGPMVAAGFDCGADQPNGYDSASFLDAASGAREEWTIPLHGETWVRGAATGVLLGGCISLIVATLGTPWEFDTRGAILLLEDVGSKPYELDCMLVHLMQAGKFRGVRGLVLGDFPKCDPPPGSRVTVRDVCRRILGPLRLPLVFNSPIGHSKRPMLTMPLGVRARLHATSEGRLHILEPAVRQENSGKKAPAKK